LFPLKITSDNIAIERFIAKNGGKEMSFTKSFPFENFTLIKGKIKKLEV